ncbi:MAG: hypothetical protein WBZ36_03905 [Candidatus Nitrosopolaris sp.]
MQPRESHAKTKYILVCSFKERVDHQTTSQILGRVKLGEEYFDYLMRLKFRDCAFAKAYAAGAL